MVVLDFIVSGFQKAKEQLAGKISKYFETEEENYKQVDYSKRLALSVRRVLVEITTITCSPIA